MGEKYFVLRYGPVCVGVMFAMAWDMWLKKFRKVTWEKQTTIILTCSALCLYLAYGTYGTYGTRSPLDPLSFIAFFFRSTNVHCPWTEGLRFRLELRPQSNVPTLPWWSFHNSQNAVLYLKLNQGTKSNNHQREPNIKTHFSCEKVLHRAKNLIDQHKFQPIIPLQQIPFKPF